MSVYVQICLRNDEFELNTKVWLTMGVSGHYTADGADAIGGLAGDANFPFYYQTPGIVEHNTDVCPDRVAFVIALNARPGSPQSFNPDDAHYRLEVFFD